MFKNGGVFASMVPTIHCDTCKDRRRKRMNLIEQEQEKGFVLILILLDPSYSRTNNRKVVKFDRLYKYTYAKQANIVSGT